jgi:hypothetical protein
MSMHLPQLQSSADFCVFVSETNQALGTFIVRFSSTRHTFVFSSVGHDVEGRLCVQHTRVEHTFKKGFSLPNNNDSYHNLEELLEVNSERFCHPQAAEATKYHYLTRIPRQRDDGYEEDHLHDSFSNLKLFW